MSTQDTAALETMELDSSSSLNLQIFHRAKLGDLRLGFYIVNRGHKGGGELRLSWMKFDDQNVIVFQHENSFSLLYRDVQLRSRISERLSFLSTPEDKRLYLASELVRLGRELHDELVHDVASLRQKHQQDLKLDPAD